MNSTPNENAAGRADVVPFREALKFWIRLGFISFGGPAGQIAIMHREVVDDKKWLAEPVFLRALNFCMLLPGPEAQQLATYIGWRLHGYWGGLAAGIWFILPAVLIIMALSWLAAAHGNVPAVAALFYGVAPVVVAVVCEAVLRIGKKALTHPVLYAFAAVAFAGGYFLRVPFPLIVLAAALTGMILSRNRPDLFCIRAHGSRECIAEEPPDDIRPPSAWHSVRLAGLFGGLWLAVVAPLWMVRGAEDVLTREAVFFTKAALVTFGGAYAVLSYIAEAGVNVYGWLSEAEMLTGLGLAESTPGPLIMVTQFVGFLGAWHHAGGASPVMMGIAGALVTTYVTFLPCFFFIFAGAPYIERLSANRGIQAALTGVTAAVVGVILKLAVFFGQNTIFPDGKTDLFALVLTVAAFVILRRTRMPVYLLVLLGALTGVGWRLLM